MQSLAASEANLKCSQPMSIFDGVKILIQDFVHSEHVNLVLLEHPAHCFVTNDVPFVRWIL